MEKIKLLICGLPGSGKTTLASRLSKKYNCVHFNADEIRSEINRDLGFSIEDRIEHARRMGVMCDIVLRACPLVIADFVCPTEATRSAFKADLVVFMDTISQGRYEDTNLLFERPIKCDVILSHAASDAYDITLLNKLT